MKWRENFVFDGLRLVPSSIEEPEKDTNCFLLGKIPACVWIRMFSMSQGRKVPESPLSQRLPHEKETEAQGNQRSERAECATPGEACDRPVHDTNVRPAVTVVNFAGCSRKLVRELFARTAKLRFSSRGNVSTHNGQVNELHCINQSSLKNLPSPGTRRPIPIATSWGCSNLCKTKAFAHTANKQRPVSGTLFERIFCKKS